MNREIISVGLSDDRNAALNSRFSVVQLSILPCKDFDRAAKLLERESCCLIILDASTMEATTAEAAIRELRNITFAPILVLSPRQAAASSL